ncbi:hypothetical protein HY503_00325 [Candidatus Woesebacteria bacterium]|nr:hypothetical protein [Candidatus Woesebacteria bacterium]
MSENKPEAPERKLNPFDALVAGIKIAQQRQRAAGGTPIPTPEIDKYIQKKKEEPRK